MLEQGKLPSLLKQRGNSLHQPNSVVSNSRFWIFQIIALHLTFAFMTKISHCSPSAFMCTELLLCIKKPKVPPYLYRPVTICLLPKAASLESKHTFPPTAAMLPRKLTHSLFHPELLGLLAEQPKPVLFAFTKVATDSSACMFFAECFY